MTLPALSENRLLRLSTVTAMYVAQGIQIGLLVVALPAYMASHGVSAVAIGGFISALILPWTLKLSSIRSLTWHFKGPVWTGPRFAWGGTVLCIHV